MVSVNQVSQHEKHVFQTSCEKRHGELLEIIGKLTSEIEDWSYKSDVERDFQTELSRLKLLKTVRERMYSRSFIICRD